MVKIANHGWISTINNHDWSTRKTQKWRGGYYSAEIGSQGF